MGDIRKTAAGKGVTREILAKQSNQSAKKINKSIKIKDIDEIPDTMRYKCVCCGKEYKQQRGNFIVSNSILFKGNNGFIPFCKDCIDRYYQQLLGFYSGNEEHALEHCCWLFDWYYNPKVSGMVRNSTANYSRVLMYPTKMNLSQVKGHTYLDTVKEKNTEEIILEEKDIAKPATISNSDITDEYVASKDTIMFFGFGYSNEDYLFLEDQYVDWTARYECKTKAQEELFKSLCITQLTIQKAQKRGSTKDITDAMKMFQDLLGTANLKPSQTNDNALADQNTFGTLIKKWENERPISEPDEEWEDVDGIKKYIDTYFFGHLCKTVEVKNDYEEMYTREMEKYTVKPPEYEESELGETSLLDKFADRGDANGDS